eukprot:scaffold270_cov390-Prasinococcus_capsulatus_cf.AAC.11
MPSSAESGCCARQPPMRITLQASAAQPARTVTRARVQLTPRHFTPPRSARACVVSGSFNYLSCLVELAVLRPRSRYTAGPCYYNAGPKDDSSSALSAGSSHGPVGDETPARCQRLLLKGCPYMYALGVTIARKLLPATMLPR